MFPLINFPDGRDRVDERGFSSIELVLVAVVICVLAAASIPRIYGSLQACRLDSTAGTLADGALAARLTAIKFNKPASIKINNSFPKTHRLA